MIKTHIIYLSVLILSISAYSACSSEKNNVLKSSDYLLAGNDISEHDRNAGVIQASPGLIFIPDSTGAIQVPADQSLLRFKLFDDPVPYAETNGLVKLILETDDLKTTFQGFHCHAYNDKTTIIELNVEKILITKEKPQQKHNKKTNDNFEIFYPTADDARIFFNGKRTYTMVVKGVSIAEGSYKSITVTFKQDGKLYHKNGQVYPVKIKDDSITYHKKFSVEKGRITTLVLDTHENHNQNQYCKNNDRMLGYHEIDPVKDPLCIFKNVLNRINNIDHYVSHSPNWCSYKKCKEFIFLAFRKFAPEEATITDPVDQAFIKFLQLNAVSGGTQVLLNDAETEIELLSLRNGAVAMMGSNMVPTGKYDYFEMDLGAGHHVVVNEQSFQLMVENWQYDSLRFMGPFDLRGGRITDVFIQFDPNKSLFYIKNKGYILEPDIIVSSIVSMTPIQELRLVESLGMMANEVMSKAELIFQGTVSTVTPVLAENIYGKNMIYSDVVLSVVDTLRGSTENNNYTLRTIGGSYNGINLKVPGMPEFSTGENVILFLKNYRGRMSVVQGEYGKLNF